MSRLPITTEAIILAKLKLGETPRQIEDSLKDVSYSQVLGLRKKLKEAEETDTLLELFKLDKVAFETLLETVRTNMADIASVVDNKVLEGELTTLKDTLSSLDRLNEEANKAGTELVRQIRTLALLTQEPNTLVMLSEALATINTSFFPKQVNMQVQHSDTSFAHLLEE